MIASLFFLTPYGSREILAIGSVLVVLAALGFRFHPLVGMLPVAGLVALFGFFRDPHRRVPNQSGIVVAPADGKVVDIGEVEEGEYLNAKAIRIGIFLSVLDVHVNRAPVDGRVEHVRHRDGRHGAAFTVESTEGNESNLVGIRTAAGDPIAVRQITGAIARRIVCRVKPGDRLELGEKYGMIKFGSRTEVYVPASHLEQVLVAVGSRVRAGESILGVLRS